MKRPALQDEAEICGAAAKEEAKANAKGKTKAKAEPKAYFNMGTAAAAM